MSIDPYHSPYPHPGQVLQEVLSEMRAIRQEAQAFRQALEGYRYDLTYNQGPGPRSAAHHLIKEAVNVAITEVINAERSKDESFIGYLQRSSRVDRPAEGTTARVESTDLPW